MTKMKKPSVSNPKAELLYEEASKLKKDYAKNFLPLGNMLRDLKKMDRKLFKLFVSDPTFKSRLAYYLINISERFYNLKVPDEILQEIGWTKLAKLAIGIKKEIVLETNLTVWLDRAKHHNDKQLTAMLKNRRGLSKTKAVVFYFDDEERPVFESAMIKMGAAKIGRESALIKLILLKDIHSSFDAV